MRKDHEAHFRTRLIELQQQGVKLACPISEKAHLPEGRFAYTVPLEHRPTLVCISEEKKRLNVGKDFAHGEYYTYASFVERIYQHVVSELRTAAHFPLDSSIEFHRDWMYSHTTLEREAGLYEDERAREGTPASVPSGGPSYEEMERWPDPPWRWPRSMLEFQLSLSDSRAFARASGYDKNTRAI